MPPIWSSWPWVMQMPRMRSFFAFQVIEVGQDEVYAEHFFFGEAHAHVDQHDVFAVFDDGHIFADLAEAADGDKSYPVVGGSWVYRFRSLH